MGKELWQWVVGYEGLYMVSNMGNVMGVPKSTRLGQLIKPKELSGHRGYLTVCLCKENKRKFVSVHRLVATAFIPNLERKPEVNHINGDKSDNRVENLEWATRSENELHAYRVLGKEPSRNWEGKPRLFARKLTYDQVRAIRSDNRPSRQIGLEYGVSKTTVSRIKKVEIYKEVV